MDRSELAEVEHELGDVARARAELRHLQARRRVAAGELKAADAAVDEARRVRADEAADVAALESWSPTRIWAGLRGRRESDLSREEAELQAADYAVAAAEQRRREAAALVAQVRAATRALGDLDARHARALVAKERVLISTETGPSGELVEIAERLGRLAAEEVELKEATAAARAAYDRLGDAVRMLERARSWSTYDTFGGGGLFTDVMKYDRMDRAAAALRDADVRLRRLRVELADVDLSGVPDVAVSGLLRAFDVWFDNIFSDWSVRSRIDDAHRAAARARAHVWKVLGVLRGRTEEAEARTARLAARRTEILTGE